MGLASTWQLLAAVWRCVYSAEVWDKFYFQHYLFILKNKVGEAHLCMLLGITGAIACLASEDVYHQCSIRLKAQLHWPSLTTLATITPAQ